MRAPVVDGVHAGGAPNALDHEPAHQARPYTAQDLAHPGKAPDPKALLPYVDNDHEEIRKQINDAKAVSIGIHLSVLSRNMSDAGSRVFIQQLDQIDDPDLRHKVMAQFEKTTGQSLRSFIENCDDWNNNGENRDKHAALQLIDDKRDKAQEAIAKMPPEVRALKEKAANDYAIQILSATTAHDHSDENMQKIFRALGGRDAVEIEMIRAAVRKHTNGESNLYQTIDDGTKKGDEDEAIAMLAGDRVGSARAALVNETDPKRLREVLTSLKKDELAQLNMVSPWKHAVLARIDNPADRAELAALFENDRAKADAEHLGNLLKPKDEDRKTDEMGVTDEVSRENYKRRKAANVLKEFEGMSGEDVKAAAEAWNKAHPERTFEMMLEARWGEDDDKTEYNRLLSMIKGDKGKNRSLRLQEGIVDSDQEEIEGALAHDKTDDKALQSTDEETRKRAEATRAENDSFERNNRESDRLQRQAMAWMRGEDITKPIAERSTKDQLLSHYAEEKAKDIGVSWKEKHFGKDSVAGRMIHAKRQLDHNNKVRDNREGALELLEDGKLSTETEFHRGDGAKAKAETLENVQSNKDLEAAAIAYKKKYGKDMLPYSGDDRADMNANELMIDNIRLYGVKSERPAQVEYLLQLQQYEKQYSKSLEADEATEAGGGTLRWQRQELAAMRAMLKDPKLAAHAPTIIKDKGFVKIEENEDEPTFEQIDKLLPVKGEKVEDGLKDGFTKQQFNMQDKGMTAANKAEATAKKRLADRICKIISTIAKIAAALTMQPHLIALIDIGSALLEMAVKHQVMGEAYDPSEDAKTLAFTVAADVALMGLSKVGKLRGAASLAEQKALGAGEKAVLEAEHAIASEAKSVATKTAVAELEHAGVGAMKSTAKSEVAKDALEIAKKIEGRWGLAGNAAKMTIQTVGGGIVQNKSPSEILQGLVAGGAGLVLPGYLTDKVKAAIGNDGLARQVLAELAGTTTDFVANTMVNVAGGAEQGDAALDALINVGGGRVQQVMQHRAAKKAQEQGPAPTHDDAATVHETTTPVPHETTTPVPHETTTPVPHETTTPVPHETTPAPHETTLTHDTTTPAHETTLIGGRDRGSPHIDLRAGDTDHRLAANAQPTIDRANAKLQAMAADVRASHEHLIAGAENLGHQVLIERAIAAGASLSDIQLLAKAMHGMPEADAMRQFSGAGIIQAFEGSCVPAAYQVAIADVNPVAALKMRSMTKEMILAQSNAMVIAGGAVTPRKDLAAPPEALRVLLDLPGMRELFGGESTYIHESSYGEGVGVDPTMLKDQALHSQLEAFTETKYEVLTNDRMKFEASDGQFTGTEIPHDRIARAVDAQRPVLIGSGDHERTIIGRDFGNGGEPYYIVQDPRTGVSKRVPQNDLQMMDLQNITLPVEGPSGSVPAPAGTERTVIGGKRDEVVVGVTTTADGQTVYELLDTSNGRRRTAPRSDIDDAAWNPRDDHDMPAAPGESYSPPLPATGKHEPSPHAIENLGESELIHQERIDRPTPPESESRMIEIEIPRLYGQGSDFREQMSWLRRQLAGYAQRDSTRPDAFSVRLRVSVDVKNYEVVSVEGQRRLVDDVVRQANRRERHLPPGSDQTIMVDVRGQDVPPALRNELRDRIVDSSDGLFNPEDIHFITDDDPE